MNKAELFNFKKTHKLFGLNKDFDFLKSLHNLNKFPRALLISGKKGEGKSTMINHLMYYIFDRENYDTQDYIFSDKTAFHKLFSKNLHENIIYLSSFDVKNIKIDDIRYLKDRILKTTINKKNRYIILDDIDLFNLSSLNALLKLIEEPKSNNYFILINNNTKYLIDTIKSRCIEIKIKIKNTDLNRINNDVLNFYNQKEILNLDILNVSPGNFLKFNYLLEENDINIKNDYLLNLKILINLYKKNKDPLFIELITFLTDYYIACFRDKNIHHYKNLIQKRQFILNKLNEFFLYNLSMNTLLNSLENHYLNE